MAINRDRSKLFIHILLIAGTLFMIIPFLWTLLTSFKTVSESIQVPPKIFPKEYNFRNYFNVVRTLPFLNFYVNTLAIRYFGVIVVNRVFECSRSKHRAMHLVVRQSTQRFSNIDINN